MSCFLLENFQSSDPFAHPLEPSLNQVSFFPRGKDRLLCQESSGDRKDTFAAAHPAVVWPDEDVNRSPESQPQAFPPARGSPRALSLPSPAAQDLLSGLCAAAPSPTFTARAVPLPVCISDCLPGFLKGERDLAPSCCVNPERLSQHWGGARLHIAVFGVPYLQKGTELDILKWQTALP